MGGFYVPVQPFGIYQAIHWLSSSASVSDQVNANKRVREMIEKGKTEDIIKLGIVSRLTELLEKTKNPQIQSETVSTLLNIAAGTSAQTQAVLRKSLSMFIKLIESGNEIVQNDVVLALSNIAGDSAKCRDKLLESGVFASVLALMGSAMYNELEKSCLWFLSNMCRYPDPAKFSNKLSMCLPTLLQYMNHKTSVELLKNVCWSLKYYSDGPKSAIDDIIAEGFCQPLIDLLQHTSSHIIQIVLLICVNITAGNNSQTQELLDCGLVSMLSQILAKPNTAMAQCNAFVAVSNIAAGTEDHIQMLIDEKIYEEIPSTYHSSDKATKIEILHILGNSICCGSESQRLYLEMIGCTEIISAGLEFDETKALKVSLDSFFYMKVCGVFKLSDSVISRIQELAQHQDKEIREAAQNVFKELSID